MTVTELEVPEALTGERIDRVVALVADLSRSDVARLIDAGAVRHNGSRVSARSMRVQAEDHVWFDTASLQEVEELEADASVPFEVVHEDEHVVIVDKPAGVVVHPGAGNTEGTLVHGLLARFPEIANVGQPERPGIVHRLDKGTSGLLAVARSAEAYAALVDALARHDVERVYNAIVWGQVEGPGGLIDAAIGRSQRDPTRMAVTARGKPAQTRYRVDRLAHGPAMTLLTCELETGRTHQIRVHLRSIGHSVIGDTYYRGARPEGLTLDRPWLHARRLAFAHPVTGEPIMAESPWPADLVAVHDAIDWIET